MQKPKLIWVVDQFGSPSKSLQSDNNKIIEKYFDLEFWDIRGLNKDWYRKNSNFTYIDSDLKILQLKNSDELKNEFDKLNNGNQKAAFLLSGKLSLWNREFVKLIENNRIPYFLRRNRSGFFQGKFAQQTVIRGLTSIKGKLIRYFYKKITNNFFMKLGIKGPNMIFAGTRFDLEQCNYPLTYSEIVHTHYKDYDHFLFTRAKKEKVSEYAVFIDQYIPFHAETIQLNIDPKLCYDAILNFIKEFEQVTGKSVIFAAHPVSDINLLKNYVPEDKIVFGKTVQLMNSAWCSISFNSAALLGSFIADTPIVLLRFESVFPKYFNMITKELENLFLTESIDITETINKEKIENIIRLQKSSHKDIFEKYVKHKNTPDLPEFEIICAKIHAYLNAFVY